MREGDNGPTTDRPQRVSARTLVDRGIATARSWSAAVVGSTVDCAAIRRWAPPRQQDGTAEFAPVLLVHGFAGTDSTWSPLRDALTDVGFDHVITLRYNTFRAGIDDVADWLVLHARRTMMGSGAAGVHLIGHSLGGLVVRHAVQNRGLGGKARTAVMMSSPQSGTWAARLLPTPASRQMRPGSSFLGDLSGQRPDPRTSWLAMHGDADRVVSRSSAMFAPGHARRAEPAALRRRAQLDRAGSGRDLGCRSPPAGRRAEPALGGWGTDRPAGRGRAGLSSSRCRAGDGPASRGRRRRATFPPVKIGIGLPNPVPELDGRRIPAWAAQAEARGFSSLATIDRLSFPNHDSMITLAAAAGVTERIRLFTNILLLPTRQPVLLAKEAASLASVSGGRFVLGVARRRPRGRLRRVRDRRSRVVAGGPTGCWSR